MFKDITNYFKDLFRHRKRIEKKTDNKLESAYTAKTGLKYHYIKNKKGCFGSGWMKQGRLIGKYI